MTTDENLRRQEENPHVSVEAIKNAASPVVDSAHRADGDEIILQARSHSVSSVTSSNIDGIRGRRVSAVNLNQRSGSSSGDVPWLCPIDRAEQEKARRNGVTGGCDWIDGAPSTNKNNPPKEVDITAAAAPILDWCAWGYSDIHRETVPLNISPWMLLSLCRAAIHNVLVG
ncbi:hypothetical protein P175DRAFT_0533896 [Aspergillus ochraceoroseus IBT 24754]|uniref:Uncharacterized protein n=1 Tax=Aspergillus ochraceoroseus IBT 24754 TaxID=1392256 RepID=A0A2T5LT65_9EURO|nr:uncharacterized protein P175DRAFT_0533896 [Aspergillus ochraceoroseus IBT 24754]PTU19461.1 hypothetical protein P175DRAFT_0533896 [Aspergillus ochraceoroseus IBT 24754]